MYSPEFRDMLDGLRGKEVVVRYRRGLLHNLSEHGVREIESTEGVKLHTT